MLIYERTFVVLSANFACLSLVTTSENDRIQELVEARLAALQITQGISPFMSLIYVLYCYLCAVTYLIQLLSYQKHLVQQVLVHQQSESKVIISSGYICSCLS